MSSIDTKESQTLNEERRTTMSTYVMVIYIAFFVFLVTVLILNTTFLPRMEEVTASTDLDSEALADAPTTVSISAESIPKIRELYFYAALVHAVGDGVLAGVIMSGKVANGLRHSFIMVLVAWLLLRLI
jgi:flagellar protein FlaJ